VIAQILVRLDPVAKFFRSRGGWIDMDIGCAPDGHERDKGGRDAGHDYCK
jgi:hypothetical protein